MDQAVFLVRQYLPNCTRGMLFAGGCMFHTLENPWRNNKQDISCIPPGVYRAVYLKRSASGRYRNVYWLQKVQGRGGILIHSGNTVADTLGCLLIGKKAGFLGSRPAVLNSRTALAEFKRLMQGKGFTIYIIGDPDNA